MLLLCKPILIKGRRELRRLVTGRLRRRAPESPAMDAREDSALRTILGNRWMPLTGRRPKALKAAIARGPLSDTANSSAPAAILHPKATLWLDREFRRGRRRAERLAGRPEGRQLAHQSPSLPLGAVSACATLPTALAGIRGPRDASRLENSDGRACPERI